MISTRIEGRRKRRLYEEMSGTDHSKREKLAGLSLNDILANQNRPGLTPPTQPSPKSRTLFDIIREDQSNKKDRRSWKAFKDKLRLKRAGSAWTSSIHIPTSDIPIQNPNSRTFSQLGRHDSVRNQTHHDSDMTTHQVDDLDPSDESNTPPPVSKPQFSRKSSTRFTPDSPENLTGSGHLRPQLSRKNSVNIPSSEPFRKGRVVTFRDSFDDDEDDDDNDKKTGRALSAREAVAAQEAAEAASEEEMEGETGHPMMSLMDLLEETDREMGLEGSRYVLSDDEDFYDDEEDEDEENGGNALEQSCCICMVKHKGSAMAACGHSFCRMCSRELMVAKGNCPLCNNFITEILDIF